MQLIAARRLAVAALLSLVVFAWPAAARADGWLSMRGVYYKEYSTRVVPPMVDARLDVAPGGSLDFHVLVDSITSASQTGPSGIAFTEERYEGGAGYTQELGDLALGASFKTSTENDYDSNYFAVRAELSLFEKNTVLALSEGRGFDTITNGVTASDLVPLRRERLYTGLTSLSLTQLLGPRLIGYLTWDFMDDHGYQANVYRRVSGGSVPVPERVPELRLRNAVYTGVRGFLAQTVTTGVLGYRFYVDDWGLVAHTLEARVIQEIVPGLDVRLRYRFYVQSSADFYRDTYTAAMTADESVFVTDDAKLGRMTTQVFGAQLAVTLATLGFQGRWSEVRMDAIVERILQDHYFGDAWSGQLGLVVPFAY